MKVNFEHCLINEKEFYAKEYQKKVPDIHNQLHSGEVYGTHWVDYPINYDKKELAKVQKLAKEIAKKIESELEYPGQIKVNVIREWRCVEYAK